MLLLLCDRNYVFGNGVIMGEKWRKILFRGAVGGGGVG